MIKRAEIFLKQLVLLIDATVLVLAFLGAYAFRQSVHVFYRLDSIPGREVFAPLKSLDTYLWLLLVILPLWLGTLHLMGAYRELRVKSYLRIAGIVLKASLLAFLCFGFVEFLLKLRYVSRSFMALFFLLSYCLLLLERAILLACFHVVLRRGYFHRNLLIVGTGPRAIRLIKAVQSHPGWGLRVIGLLDDDLSRVVRVVTAQSVAGVTLLGTLAQIPEILQQHVVDEVIFVVPRSWMTRVEPSILACELAGIRATVAVDLFNMRFAKSHPSDLDGIPLLSFDATPTGEWQLAIKRLIDVVASAVVILVLLPFLPILIGLMKAASSGPVLFRQIRCGLNGRRFTLYKFRSMVVDAEAKQAGVSHLNELTGPVFKATDDPRLTPVGKWLRKTSVDELPQLFNVLKGEMSLVGPRPSLPSEVGQYEPWQRRRLSMRPGITGYWQVNGRNGITDFNKWMRLDLAYIDQWSLRLDAKILLKTIPAVLFGIGAK